MVFPSHTDHLRKRVDFSSDIESLILQYEGKIPVETLEQDAKSVFAAYRPDEPSHIAGA